MRKPSTNLTLSSVTRRLAAELMEQGGFATRTSLVEYLLRREHERVFGPQKALEEGNVSETGAHAEGNLSRILGFGVQKGDSQKQIKSASAKSLG